VFFFGTPEPRRVPNLGVDRDSSKARIVLHGQLRALCGLTLFRVIDENRRAVVRTDIAELAIIDRGVDVAPVDVQKLAVVDPSQIVSDLDYLEVSRATG
jgi:chromosome condensin MukBEF ATPase and DNA-binding subunit MukB